jgi:hypothetical protein
MMQTDPKTAEGAGAGRKRDRLAAVHLADFIEDEGGNPSPPPPRLPGVQGCTPGSNFPRYLSPTIVIGAPKAVRG